jgi:hypothetical protein
VVCADALTVAAVVGAGGRGPEVGDFGFDLDDDRQQGAIDRMGPGWRDTVLPRLEKLLTEDGR